MASGDAYERAAARARRRAGDQGRLLGARRAGHPRGVRRCSAPIFDGGCGATATSRSRSTPASPTTRSRRSAKRCACTSRSTSPNLMVKIPATKPGLAAIEDVIAKGKSINVTLIFSLRTLRRRRRVLHPRPRAPRRRGRRPDARSASVASFFVSRIDTEADKRLDEIGGHDELKGKLAVANARLAYQRYKEIFAGPRWEYLESKGATPQRVLWASTSVKNPDYPRHAVRRGADRPGHRQHDARGDDQRLPGPRPPAPAPGVRARAGAQAVRRSSPPPASTTRTSPTRSSARASRNSPAPSTSCCSRWRRSARRSSPPERARRLRRAGERCGARLRSRAAGSAP